MLKKYIFIIILILIQSCTKDDNSEEEYYPTGELKSKVGISDGIRDGEFEVYYENGKLKSKGKYNHGILVDTIYNFYPNGVLELKLPVPLNSKDKVVSTSYYPSGKLKFKIDLVEGKKRGQGFLYFEKSGALKAYIYYADNSEVMYRRDYNESGTLIKEEGSLAPERLWLNKVNFKVGETMEGTVFTIEPPKCHIKVYSGKYDLQKGVLINKEELAQSEVDGFYRYKKTFENQGDYYWGVYFELGCETLLSEKERTEFVKITVN